VGRVSWREAAEVDPQRLTTVHDARYVDRVFAGRGQRVVLDPDTTTSAGSVHAAACAAGAAVAAVDAVLTGETQVGWCLVRPPGHHAERDRAMGFCLFNNVAVAAAHAIAEHGLERVLVVDPDLHHGNGTQHLFEDRDDVLFYSSHQYGGGFYPGSGAVGECGVGAGAGLTINAPLAPGAGDSDLVTAFRERLVPLATDWRPQLVLVSAGFDGHHLDPLGGLRFTEAGFAELARHISDLADRFAGGRVVLVLEGGYHLGALERSVAAVADVM